MPSAITYRCARVTGGRDGSTFQHHAMRAADACRVTPRPAAASLMDRLPVSHARNTRNSAMRAASSRSAVELSRHASHFQRCVPAFANPFLRIGLPHTGHLLAFEDLGLLMEQANPKSQAPRRINTQNVNHTTTRKTPVSLTPDLRPTFLYLTLYSRMPSLISPPPPHRSHPDAATA